MEFNSNSQPYGTTLNQTGSSIFSQIKQKHSEIQKETQAVTIEKVSQPGYVSNLIKVAATEASAKLREKGGELSELEIKISNGESFNIFYEGNEKNQKITQFPGSSEDVAQIKGFYNWEQATSLPGSTGWVYPQENWTGGENPIPPLTLNNAKYSSIIIKDNNRVTMTSPYCRETDIQSVRDFDFSKLEEGTVKIKHRLINKGDTPREWGIWTLDRLKPGGIILLNGTKDQLRREKGDSLPEENINQLKEGWLEISSKNAPFSKYGLVPNGNDPFMAYILPVREGKQGYAVFIKRSLQGTVGFPEDYEKNCPAEICFNPFANLIEFELKGPLSEIKTGGSTKEFMETRQLLYAGTKQELEALIQKLTGIHYKYKH